MNQTDSQSNPPASQDWILWQLLDSAFPTGGFAHSNGLEAAAQLGEVADERQLEQFCEASVLQAARAAMPLALAARTEPDRLWDFDQLCDAMLRNHVANRASRAQGQSFLIAAERAFGAIGIGELRSRGRRERLPGHFAPAFGAAAGMLGLDRRTTARALLFLHLRGLVSSAVRLGLVGPLRAQALQFDLGGRAQRHADRLIDHPVERAAQTAPIADILQGSHDRLYSRLFQS
jgi:urease accessory protein